MANPLQSFLTGEAGRRAAERHPLEQAQREVGIERQKQTLQQQGRQFDQNETLKGAQIMQQVVDRVKQVQDPNQRLQIFERVRPELQKFGVELPPNLTVDSVTDQGLVPLETGIGQTIQKLTTGQRDTESQARSLVGVENPETGKPFSLEEARQAITLRNTGITAKAGTETFRERVAGDQGAVDKIADLERQLEESKALGKGAGASTSKVIEDSFNRIGNIQGNIRNIDRAISALDRGANTGAVQKFLPSITAASKELDQIRSELGLDIVGSVTFGALSEGELSLALDVALPDGLDEPQLKDFLERKKEAQNKLIGYLDDQIEFLEDGGTLGGWRALVRRSGQQAPTQQAQPQQQAQEQQPGFDDSEGQVMVDANGNRALVFPDGTFKEL